MTLPDQSPALLPPPADPLCLDFANTLFWRGTKPSHETLQAPADLLSWLEGAGMPGIEATRTRWADTASEAETALRTAIDLRETIYRILAGPDPAPDDLDSLNHALAVAPERRRLERTPTGFAWRTSPWTPTLRCLLAPVVWSAADLLASPRRNRVRTCANPQCQWLFLDDSKAGNRRWCSMASCGNRAKAHRHYARTRGKRMETE